MDPLLQSDMVSQLFETLDIFLGPLQCSIVATCTHLNTGQELAEPLVILAHLEGQHPGVAWHIPTHRDL